MAELIFQGPGPAGPPGPLYPTQLGLVGNIATTDQTGGYVLVGGAYINSTDYTSVDATLVFQWKATLFIDDASGHTYCELYNLTDGAQVHEFDCQATTPTEYSFTVVPGTTPNFPAANKLFEVRIKTTAGRLGSILRSTLTIVQP